jgi:hypothetical protein
MIGSQSSSIERKEHLGNIQAKKVVNVDIFGGLVTDGNFTQRITESAGVTYIGKSQIGSAETDGVWQIMKVTESTTTKIEWANSSDEFIFKWSERETYEYK